MKATSDAQRLIQVRSEIESLLARRASDDFGPPLGYRALVTLESALLRRTRPLS